MILSKVVLGFQTLDRNSEGMRGMIEGNFAETFNGHLDGGDECHSQTCAVGERGPPLI